MDTVLYFILGLYLYNRAFALYSSRESVKATDLLTLSLALSEVGVWVTHAVYTGQFDAFSFLTELCDGLRLLQLGNQQANYKNK